MLTVTSDDVVRMKDALSFDGDQPRRKLASSSGRCCRCLP